MNIIAVLIGGGIGALMRYIVDLGLGKNSSIHGFPFSTFLVNILGCFLIGIVGALALRYKWSESMVLFVMTGFLGGFTTFSSFGLEFLQLIKNNQGYLAFLYLGLSNFVGIGLCALGYHLAK